MSELKNYIGIKTLPGDEPTSGRYVNELAGISTELADNISNTEQADFAGVWADVEKRAIARFVQAFKALLKQEVEFSSSVVGVKKLKPVMPVEFLPVSNSYVGVCIHLPDSDFMKVQLNAVTVFAKAAGDVEAKVFDLSDGTELKSEIISLSAGLNRIDFAHLLENRYAGSDFFIALDASVVEFARCLHISHYLEYKDEYLEVYPASIEKAKDKYEPHLVGESAVRVWIDAGIFCDVEKLLFNNIKAFEIALLNLLGFELLDEKLSSPRVNFFTYNDEERSEELREEYETRYLEEMKVAFEQLSIPHDVCFSCLSEPVSYGTTMP